jgi:hypothetical protein
MPHEPECVGLEAGTYYMTYGMVAKTKILYTSNGKSWKFCV